jgi:hypothetical protein
MSDRTAAMTAGLSLRGFGLPRLGQATAPERCFQRHGCHEHQSGSSFPARGRGGSKMNNEPSDSWLLLRLALGARTPC